MAISHRPLEDDRLDHVDTGRGRNWAAWPVSEEEADAKMSK
jgi:hypothetical protein